MPPPDRCCTARRARGGAMADVRQAEERLYATADVRRTTEGHGTRPALWGQYGSGGDPAPGPGARPWHHGAVRPSGIGWTGAVDARRYGDGGGYVQPDPESDGRWSVCRTRCAPRRGSPRA